MFNKHSIFFAITISFVISLILVVGSFFLLHKMLDTKEEHSLKRKYYSIARMIHSSCQHSGLSQELKKHIESMGMKLLEDEKALTRLFEEDKKLKLLFGKREKGRGAKLLCDGSYYYLFIQTPHELLVFKDMNKIEEAELSRFVLFFVFALIFVALILSFFVTVKKLYPLKKLKDSVKNLGDENFDFESFEGYKKDEVAQLAKEFSHSAKKLHSIKEARNIFIRNIMHELKTPITKGKFLVELPDSVQNREKMKKVFYRLELLINEFASIEELISTQKELEKKEYFVADIVDNALDLLLVESGVRVDVNSSKVTVHFKLFSLAIKNLVDNALKYSSDKQVSIKAHNKTIIISNRGKPLNKPLREYLEPFVKEEKFASESFGLGLYIVHNILKANKMGLRYEHKDNQSHFIIE